MTSIHHPLIALSSVLPKLCRRLPPAWQSCQCWADLEDHMYSSGVLSGRNAKMLHAAEACCRTPSDWFDFAAHIFPSHQQKIEILGFLDLAATVEPKIVMEIGTAQSGTQFLLGQGLLSTEIILAVDLRVRNRRLLEAFSRPGLKRTCLVGSSYDPQTVQRVAGVLDGRPIDVLFIDGDHTYEGVKADYEAYAPLVRSGGLIAFHDIIEDHQTRYGRSSGGWAGDVPRFWREVSLGQKTWEFIADPEQDGMGIGVIEVQG
jgi:cephalosporin hydroxylase